MKVISKALSKVQKEGAKTIYMIITMSFNLFLHINQNSLHITCTSLVLKIKVTGSPKTGLKRADIILQHNKMKCFLRHYKKWVISYIGHNFTCKAWTKQHIIIGESPVYTLTS